MAKLTSAQRDDLIEQFVEIQLENMDTQSLYELASEYLIDSFDRLTDGEIKERVESLYDEELYEELVDNVTNSADEVAHCIVDTNGDYAECVDRMVESMEASK